MTETPSKHVSDWLWGLVVIVVIVAVAVLLTHNRAKQPPAVFQYHPQPVAQTGAARLLFRQADAFPPTVPKPRAMAIGSGNRIYVAGSNALAILNAHGAKQQKIEIHGSPNAIAVAPNGAIVLGMRDHIAILAPNGSPQIKSQSLGKRAYLTAVIANKDNIYAADAGNRILLRFNYQGKLLNRIGKADPKRDIPGFVIPSPHLDLAFDPNGGFWATNPGRLGLEQYRPDGSLVSSWYRPSATVNGFVGCCNPIKIAFRPDGSLVTAEKDIARIKLYSPTWRLEGLVAGPNAFTKSVAAANADGLDTPIAALGVDSDGSVVVLDAGLNAIRVFEPIKSS